LGAVPASAAVEMAREAVAQARLEAPRAPATDDLGRTTPSTPAAKRVSGDEPAVQQADREPISSRPDVEPVAKHEPVPDATEADTPDLRARPEKVSGEAERVSKDSLETAFFSSDPAEGAHASRLGTYVALFIAIVIVGAII